MRTPKARARAFVELYAELRANLGILGPAILGEPIQRWEIEPEGDVGPQVALYGTPDRITQAQPVVRFPVAWLYEDTAEVAAHALTYQAELIGAETRILAA